MKEVILIFQKNPVLGKVKTRLAINLGEENALRIYKFLLEKTHRELARVDQDKLVFHSDFIPETEPNFQNQRIQKGIDLGEKMKNAFDEAFSLGYKKVVIIGADCPELSEVILNEAFAALNDTELVIGPAADGGYYLLGMNGKNPELFENIEWSTDTVLKKTLEIAEKSRLSFSLLPILHDIDEAKDWQRFITQNPQYESV